MFLFRGFAGMNKCIPDMDAVFYGIRLLLPYWMVISVNSLQADQTPSVFTAKE